jgi:hypothetical protein
MTTIKFPRPDGEARLTTPGLPVDFSFSWRPSSADAYQPDGGFVLIECRHGKYAYFPKGIGLDRELAKFVDPSPILLAAEKLRNEKRRLAEDEWRDDIGTLYAFSRPVLTGLTVGWNASNGDDRSESYTWEQIGAESTDNFRSAALAYHRRAYFPLLQPDECYPPGELPRKMADDEVRFPDGSAGRMVAERANETWTKSGMRVVVRSSRSSVGDRWWAPDMATPCADHSATVDGQLARLQAFWERSQPKEDGPPVELAEDVFLNVCGKQTPMRMAGRCLEHWVGDAWAKDDRDSLVSLAKVHPGYVRALAYFDRHVAKHPLDSMARTFTDEPDALLIAPEPARVTDVRFEVGGVRYMLAGRELPLSFFGTWHAAHKKDALHPLDIALIERCWAEARLGEREVLDDQGRAWSVDCQVNDTFPILLRREDMALGMAAKELASDHPNAWWWMRADEITIHDPAQRARVRAIVAGMKKESTGGPASAQTDAGASADSGAARAVLTEADSAESPVVGSHGSVSPSGVVKAPFGLEPDAEGHVCFGPLRFSRDPGDEDEGRWFLTIDDIERTEDPETLFRDIYAALSDHIRRGDGDEQERKRRDVVSKLGTLADAATNILGQYPSAPDLTELREAVEQWNAGDIGCRQVAQVAERLVAK